MADPMEEEAAAFGAPPSEQEAAIAGHDDDLLLMDAAREAVQQSQVEPNEGNNKRSASPSTAEEEEGASNKRRRKTTNNPPPKKLNNEQWDAMFERLVEYKRQHGDCLVPKRYAADPKLGTWVETQRIQWKKLPRTQAQDGEVVTPNNRLNDERLKRLESIGFAWSAKNMRKSKQPAVASFPLAEPSQQPLQQGGSKRAASSQMLDPAEKAAARQRENDKQWIEMYNRLVVYRNTHGDCLVPKKYQEDPKLASWVETQRNLYNREYKQVKSSPKMDSGSSSNEDVPPPPAAAVAKSPEEWADEMERAATSAVMTAAMDVEAAAMQVVDEVTASPDNSAKQPAATVADEKMPAKRLTQERKNMLDHLGFVWSLRSKRTDDHWDDMYRQLVEYKEKNGDCLVPSRYEANVKLGKWVETQRYEYTKLQRVAGQSEAQVEEQPPPPPPEEGKAGKKTRTNNPRLTEERRRRLEAIGFEWKVKNKMKRYYDQQWDGMFEKLLKFKEENGHCLVPKRYIPDMKLGTWVHTQRIQYRKMLAGTAKKDPADAPDGGEGSEKGEEKNFRLTEDRRRRLDEVGFVWSARDNDKTEAQVKIARNSYDDQWDAMFERLRAYKEMHGHCLVPKRCKEDPKLGTWVDTQRVQRKKMLKHMAKQEPGDSTTKAPGRLTADRTARLESIGFVWSLRDDWQKHYDELKAYRAKHGNCNVPARYAENRKLGIWVSAQRQQKKLIDTATDAKPSRSTPLTQERINMLNDIGFTWTIRSRDSLGESWNHRLEELKAFQREHGNCLVPSRYPPNPELGIWVGTQRTQYRLYMKAKEAGRPSTSAMNEERIAQLEELGFAWSRRGCSDTAWRKRIAELLEYRSVHGDTAVPSTYEGNKKLAGWAATQRVQYRLMQEGKHSTLDEEKIAELDSLHFPWDEPRSEGNQQIVDDAVAGALAVAAAAAEMNNGEAMGIDAQVRMLGGQEDEEEPLNVAI